VSYELSQAYLRTKWQLNPSSRLATIDMGRKLQDAVPLLRGGELGPHLTQGSPPNTMSPGPMPTSVPSDILIHPAGWPQ